MKLLKRLNPGANKLFTALVCLCAIFTFNTAKAQEGSDAEGSDKSSGGKIAVGITTGANWSKLLLSGSDAASQYRFGYNVGAFANIGFNKWLAVQPELAFSQTAAGRVGYGVNETSLSGLADYKLNNIRVNALVDVRLPLISVYKPRFYFGPSFDINMYANADVEGDYLGNPVTYNVDATDQFKALDFGMVVGAGLDFDMKGGVLKIDARYRQGVSNISNVNFNQNNMFPYKTIHTQMWSFQVGYGMRF